VDGPDLLPDIPRPKRRYEVTLTVTRGPDEELLPPDEHALAELAAAAVCAEGLLGAWTAARSVLSMMVEVACPADALSAGVAVARTIGAQGCVSVAARPA
jgi:hypothetical protein